MTLPKQLGHGNVREYPGYRELPLRAPGEAGAREFI